MDERKRIEDAAAKLSAQIDEAIKRKSLTDAELRMLLGFHPLEGGRRLGEMVVRGSDDPHVVWVEIPGALVSLEKAKAISRILKGDQA